MEFIVELVISVLIVIGGLFTLIGSFGLVKLPNLLMRLHAPTKATTVGVGSILIASMLFFWVERGTFTIHELLITIFLFLTAPITANLIGKAYLLRHVDPKDDLPHTGEAEGWATFDVRDPEEQPRDPGKLPQD
ncbi:cation:proton antiporter [Thalassospira profundimaris]|uniref:Cation:proton antiporter n=1 Tax=Thalassospira profundimaris TaxID=502049 RepID=A0A367X033_9PROT|nr:Na+/H+ antiporter subunit G [Thalassospira profundimaris]RCK47043.1 cation:proton antiporter [Thalassospira profundimaris]